MSTPERAHGAAERLMRPRRPIPNGAAFMEENRERRRARMERRDAELEEDAPRRRQVWPEPAYEEDEPMVYTTQRRGGCVEGLFYAALIVVVLGFAAVMAVRTGLLDGLAGTQPQTTISEPAAPPPAPRPTREPAGAPAPPTPVVIIVPAPTDAPAWVGGGGGQIDPQAQDIPTPAPAWHAPMATGYDVCAAWHVPLPWPAECGQQESWHAPLVRP